MQHYLMAIVVIVVGGLTAWFTGRLRPLSAAAGMVSCVVGAVMAFVPVVQTLIYGIDAGLYQLNLPLGLATLRLDHVSAFFSLPVLILGAISAVYAAAINYHDRNESGSYWFFYNLLFATMLLLVVSANAAVFLMAWEIMSVAAFFLIIHRDEIASARMAGWRFLVASHIGTAALFLLFAMLSAGSGSFEFASFTAAKIPSGSASVIFFLALFGFGVKVGMLALHVWLPDSYTYADAHVSALLSGAMSKMGFYGLVRVMMFLADYQSAWGWALLTAGLLTGVYALIMALAQQDMKKVIAYSSMENAGIILMGLGCGVLAGVWKQPVLAFAAFAGAFLHIFNHSVCKGLLFLGSGAIYYGVGTRKLELMGGLARKMPFTAVTFGIGAAAIAGLPPFNNFYSEFMIFLAGLQAAKAGSAAALLLSGTILAGLGLIGGLAMACFARTFGLFFLGASRNEKRNAPEEVNTFVKIPLGILVFIIFASSLAAPWLLYPVGKVVAAIGAPAGLVFSAADVLVVAGPVRSIMGFSLCLILLAVSGWLLKCRFFSAGDVYGRCTWDCGFAAPDARIQYTSSSFSQPVVEVFSSVARPFRHGEPVSGLFPQKASFRTETQDSLLRYLHFPLFGLINRGMVPLRKLQHGRLHLYICYIAIVLLVLLLWKVVAA